MALTDPWSGEDDTDCDYYDTPSGNLWCPDDEPGQQAPGHEPRARVAHASSATHRFCQRVPGRHGGGPSGAVGRTSA
jgi:hypothetical protein